MRQTLHDLSAGRRLATAFSLGLAVTRSTNDTNEGVQHLHGAVAELSRMSVQLQDLASGYRY